MSVGNRLKEARLAARLTQRELGGGRYSPSYICQLEKDKIRPSVKALEFLGGRLGKTVNYFFADAESLAQIGRQEHDADTLQFLLNQAEVYLASGKNDLAKNVIEKASTINLAPEKQAMKASFLRISGRIKTTLDQKDEAEKDLLEALSIYTDLALPEESIKTYLELARLHSSRQKYGQARSCLRKTLKIIKSEQIADPVLILDALRNAGELRLSLGEVKPATVYLEKALGQVAKISDPTTLVELYLELGSSYAKQDIKKALRYSQKALGIFESVQNTRRAADVYLSLGKAFREIGKNRKALQLLNRSEELFSKSGDDEGRRKALAEIAQIHLDPEKPTIAKEIA